MKAPWWAIQAVLALCPCAAAQEVTPYDHYRAVYDSSTRPIEAFAKIVHDRPDDAWARHFHARAFMDGRDLYAARVALDRAIALDPAQSFHRRLLGDLETLRGDLEAAARAYRAAAAVESRPEPARFLADLAEKSERLQSQLDATIRAMTFALGGAVVAGGVVFFLTMRRVRPETGPGR